MAGEFGRNPVVRAMVPPPAEVDRCQWQGPYEERFVPWFDHFVEDVLQGGKDAWTLHGSGFTGYALRRDGVLVTVCADSERARDDLPAVARALHPLDDHQLWTHLSLGWAPTWLAM
ncbi:hypothetical protein [Kitasatospora sp. NPDC001175]|uniref:hypothetical protein n=1 Tax=Kitasatospora sp. NPDC001175 TaxID=3157103 RepID=UPI003D01B98A